MSPSTSLPDSKAVEPRVLAALWAGVLAGPIAWLVALEAGYASSYLICAGWSRSVVHAATLVPIVLIAAAAFALAHVHKRQPHTGWPAWMAAAGVMLCSWFTLVILATDVPVMILQACK